VAHTCNTSYSGDRDQEDCCSKQVWEIVHENLSWKYPAQKRTGGEAQSVGPQFKPQHHTHTHTHTHTHKTEKKIVKINIKTRSCVSSSVIDWKSFGCTEIASYK
jgi:hypothetical protein